MTRGEVIEIRDYYKRADIWEKREILKIMQKKLSEDENRPFLKDVRLHTNDLFEKCLACTKKDKNDFRKISNVIKNR